MWRQFLNCSHMYCGIIINNNKYILHVLHNVIATFPIVIIALFLRPHLTTLSVSLPSLYFTDTSRQHNTKPDKALFTPVSAEDLGFTLTNVSPDGDCFFHCIWPHTISHRQLPFACKSHTLSMTIGTTGNGQWRTAITLEASPLSMPTGRTWQQQKDMPHGAKLKLLATYFNVLSLCGWLPINDILQYIPILHTPHCQRASHLRRPLKRNHNQLMSMGESNKNVPTKITRFINKKL